MTGFLLSRLVFYFKPNWNFLQLHPRCGSTVYPHPLCLVKWVPGDYLESLNLPGFAGKCWVLKANLPSRSRLFCYEWPKMVLIQDKWVWTPQETRHWLGVVLSPENCLKRSVRDLFKIKGNAGGNFRSWSVKRWVFFRVNESKVAWCENCSKELGAQNQNSGVSKSLQASQSTGPNLEIWDDHLCNCLNLMQEAKKWMGTDNDEF